MMHCRLALKMALTVILVASLLIILPGCTKKDDISGTWKGKVTLPQTGKSLSDLKFILAQKGKEVTGTMVFTKPGETLQLNGTVTDGRLTLSSMVKHGLSVTINATLENTKSIRGAAVLEYSTPQLMNKQDKVRLEMTR